MDDTALGLAWISDEEIRRHDAYISGVWARPLRIPPPRSVCIVGVLPTEPVVVTIDSLFANIKKRDTVRSISLMPLFSVLKTPSYVTWHDMVERWSDGVRCVVDKLIISLDADHTYMRAVVYEVQFEFREPISKWLPRTVLPMPDDCDRVRRVMDYDGKEK